MGGTTLFGGRGALVVEVVVLTVVVLTVVVLGVEGRTLLWVTGSREVVVLLVVLVALVLLWSTSGMRLLWLGGGWRPGLGGTMSTLGMAAEREAEREEEQLGGGGRATVPIGSALTSAGRLLSTPTDSAAAAAASLF